MSALETSHEVRRMGSRREFKEVICSDSQTAGTRSNLVRQYRRLATRRRCLEIQSTKFARRRTFWLNLTHRHLASTCYRSFRLFPLSPSLEACMRASKTTQNWLPNRAIRYQLLSRDFRQRFWACRRARLRGMAEPAPSANIHSWVECLARCCCRCRQRLAASTDKANLALFCRQTMPRCDYAAVVDKMRHQYNSCSELHWTVWNNANYVFYSSHCIAFKQSSCIKCVDRV